MSKTIQVRVDESIKDSADLLFESLGLDTSTAVRIFLVAAVKAGGIPFAVAHDFDRDAEIHRAILRRKAGAHFYTADEFLANMRVAINEGAGNV